MWSASLEREDGQGTESAADWHDVGRGYPGIKVEASSMDALA